MAPAGVVRNHRRREAPTTAGRHYDRSPIGSERMIPGLVQNRVRGPEAAVFVRHHRGPVGNWIAGEKALKQADRLTKANSCPRDPVRKGCPKPPRRAFSRAPLNGLPGLALD